MRDQRLTDQGENVWDKNPVTFHCYRNVSQNEMNHGHRYAFRTVIYYSSAFPPPLRLTSEVDRLCAIKT